MKKYIAVDIGLGIEVKEVNIPTINIEYIKKAVIFITAVMIYYCALGAFIASCVK
jgi:hypothetical protein